MNMLNKFNPFLTMLLKKKVLLLCLTMNFMENLESEIKWLFVLMPVLGPSFGIRILRISSIIRH